MAIDKKLIKYATKARFTADLGNSLIPTTSIVFIQDTGELWTHGIFFGGHFSSVDSNYGTLTLDGSSVNLSLYGHKHNYTDLLGSTTTANQAIVSNGTANGWTLATLGSNAFNSTSYLPLSGGTLTGQLSINTNNAYPLALYGSDNYSVLSFNGHNTSQVVDIGWLNDYRGNLACISNISSKGVISVNNTGCFYSDDINTFTKYKIWHEGNFTPGNYLPLSGGTLTGALITNPNVLGWVFRNAPGWYGSISYDSYGGECLGIMFKNSGTKFKVKAGYDSSSFAGDNAYTSMTNADLEVGAGYAKINGNTVWHAGNDGSGSGLDADMLDGLHSTSMFQNKGIRNEELNTLLEPGNYFIGDQAANRPCTYGTLLVVGQSDTRAQLALGYTGESGMWYRGSGGELSTTNWSNWYQIAFTTSNVASSTKLATARTLWGQSFDGTGNVSGEISGCSRISNSGSALYLGNANNASWVYVQDICSQLGANYWRITQDGGALFSGTVTCSNGITGNLTGNVTGNVSGSAGSVAWGNVSGRPTALSQFSNDSGFITNSGTAYAATTLSVTDNRDADRTPDYYAAHSISTFFNDKIVGSWKAGITVKGWSSDYASWQLFATSTFSVDDTNLYFRQGINSTWNSVITLITSNNIASQSVSYANSAGNASTLGSLSLGPTANTTANSIVRTDSNGYIQCGYLNSASGGGEKNASSPPYVWGTNGSDTYLRTYATNNLSVAYAANAGAIGGYTTANIMFKAGGTFSGTVYFGTSSYYIHTSGLAMLGDTYCSYLNCSGNMIVNNSITTNGINRNVAVVTTTTTLSPSLHIIYANNAYSEITLYLPSSPTDGQEFIIKGCSGTKNKTIHGNGHNLWWERNDAESVYVQDVRTYTVVYSSILAKWGMAISDK